MELMATMLMVVTFVAALAAGATAYTDTGELPVCQPDDFHFEYTRCDSSGGRWLVSVPTLDKCTGGSPPPPVRGKRCDFSCKAGQYLDVKHGQECKPCPAGQYSLGGGVRFDSWEQLPAGFSVELEEFASRTYSPQRYQEGGRVNCTGAGWLPRDKYLITDISDCTSVLIYVADLVQPGSVTFTYQNSDDTLLFTFEVQNSKCQTIKDRLRSRYLKTTEDGVWQEEKVPLNSGVNRLHWRALSTTFGKQRLHKNVMISKIEIMGVAYTSECTECPAGTYNGELSSSECLECAADTFSRKGATSCQKCAQDEYSDPGSYTCQKRPTCTENDYLISDTPCNEDGMTRKAYSWIEPRICNPKKSGSVKLPTDGDLEPCPPCNPGMEMRNGKCEFCPLNHYSNGKEPCAACPGSTAPETGLVYQWWNNLPANANISFFCLSLSERNCAVKEGWAVASDHIYTLKGNRANAYALVSLRIGGFRDGQESPMTSSILGISDALVVGTISFVFETICTGQCSFIFIQHAAKDLIVIDSWTGNTPKTKYIYNITSDHPVNFSWSFQQQLADDNDYSVFTNRLNDMAKIYVINVTNTQKGGAGRCKPCPKGTIMDRCIPCPEGSYVDQNTTECKSCPANTVVRGGINPWGIESCVACSEGLEPYKKTRCVSKCTYKTEDNSYDFSSLAGVHTIEGPHLFMTSGYRYYHMFNISLCYLSSNGSNLPMATCYSNVSKEQSEEQEDLMVYQLPVCRSTIFPSSPGDASPPVSIHPLSLSDVLLAVTNKPDKYNITELMKEAKFYSEDNLTRHTNVHFIFMSDLSTSACRNGRRTIITLRCDLKDTSRDGKLILPPHCPDGTCNGCDFVFLWTSAFACPRCTSDDYTEFKENCVNGKQRIMKRPVKMCYPDTASIIEVQCSWFWQDSWPLWLRVVIILVPVVVVMGLILFITVCYCWMKNRKLTYKYSKLIESSGGKDGELPGVETCALDEGEEDEQFDAVDFKKKTRFFRKFTTNPRRGKDSILFENIRLNEKSPLT